MNNKFRGNRVVSGSWGELWWDGEKIFDVSKFELKVTTEREDVPGEGLDMDSKLVGLKGEGSFSIKKVYSRGINKLVKAWLEGIDPRSGLIATLDDPDAFGAERVSVNNVWFEEATIMQFEKKKTIEEEYKFGFTPSDVNFEELIV